MAQLVINPESFLIVISSRHQFPINGDILVNNRYMSVANFRSEPSKKGCRDLERNLKALKHKGFVEGFCQLEKAHPQEVELFTKEAACEVGISPSMAHVVNPGTLADSPFLLAIFVPVGFCCVHVVTKCFLQIFVAV